MSCYVSTVGVACVFSVFVTTLGGLGYHGFLLLLICVLCMGFCIGSLFLWVCRYAICSSVYVMKFCALSAFLVALQLVVVGILHRFSFQVSFPGLILRQRALRLLCSFFLCVIALLHWGLTQ